MLGDATEVTEFRPGPGRDLTDVRFEGEIAGLESDCDYDEDGFVDVEVAVNLALSRGPAAEGNVGHYEYFVAIADPSDTIITKQSFPLDVEFPGAALRVEVQEEVRIERIVFAPAADASRFRVFVGFQLTRDQLDYLRRRRR